MNRIEVGGDKWRTIGDPLTERSMRQLASLLTDAPGMTSSAEPLTESARQLGIDHLPLATMVAMLAADRRRQARQITDLLGIPHTSSPFVLGVTGGVAVGKSMAAEAVATLLREQLGLTTAVVTTDGFLRANATLEAQGLMHRKGFPESYDHAALLTFLEGVRAGRKDLVAPRYDHLASDVLDERGPALGRLDVLVLEGINVLQPAPDPSAPSVADHLDLSVYVDAEEDLMHDWFTARLLDLRARPAGEAPSHFAATAMFSDDEFVSLSDVVWEQVNLHNLVEHIAPTRQRADLVLEKGADHRVRRVLVRG
jgi:type I pantothenate kinase